MVESKEAAAKPLTKEKAEGEKGEEQVEEETKEVGEVAPEVPEKKVVEEKPRHVPLGKSRVIERATKEDFMGFARKFYPSLVEDFEAKRIPFDELKSKIERDVGVVWVEF